MAGFPEAMGSESARLISLQPSGPRYQAFAERNQHLYAEVFQAVRGDGGNLHDSIEANLITPDLKNSGLLHPGTLGTALSHRALWQQAAAGSTLILEDDVVSDPELAAWISANHPNCSGTASHTFRSTPIRSSP